MYMCSKNSLFFPENKMTFREHFMGENLVFIFRKEYFVLVLAMFD